MLSKFEECVAQKPSSLLLCVDCCRSTRGTEMKQGRDTESVKMFSPKETSTRDSMNTAKDTAR